ncbi:hypothetical protein VYU27_003310 [Nannochloropsis oceanica]
MTRASTRGGRLHPEITTLEFALSHTQNHRASQRKQTAPVTSSEPHISKRPRRRSSNNSINSSNNPTTEITTCLASQSE